MNAGNEATACSSSAAQSTNSPSFPMPTFNKDIWSNPESFNFRLPGYRAVAKFLWAKSNADVPSSEQERQKELPIKQPNFAVPDSATSYFHCTWIGHATVLVQTDGVTFLTDPIWSNRCSPVSFAGPARYRPPPCTIDELPKIDFCVISHNHYDHLDLSTVKQLEARFAPALKWYVPMGLRSWMERHGGCRNVTEMNWGDQTQHNADVNVVALPAKHWSTRGPNDRFKTLWCGWAVLSRSHRFYFAGDTGFNENGFRAIGQKYGPFDLAAIPIGCYEPRDFMCAQHCDPDEAVSIHNLVRARRSLAIHWGTFNMGSTEFYLDPRNRLQQAQKNVNAGTEFCVKAHGDTWIID